jgi:hypothetical protein
LRRTFLLVILGAVAVLLVRIAFIARDYTTVVTAVRFEALRSDHAALRSFLRRMPKGGDLHVHLSGSVYAERVIAWAILDGLCVRLSDLSIVPPPCLPDSSVPAAETQRNQPLYDRLVNSLSMRFFLPSPATPSGHDQFFSTFGRFGLSSQRADDMVVNQLAQYQADGVQYVEFMLTFLPAEDRRRLGQAIAGQTDFAMMLDTLNRNDELERVVDGMRKQVADLSGRIDAALDCGSERAKAGCQVTYRFIAQVARNNPLEEVFVQTAAAAALVRAEPRVVALNFVQTEDHQIARRDYRTHMRMVEFLTKDIPVALHAGELWLGLVPPDDLTFHITEAATIAGARRIGHGTALAFEHDVNGLLQTLRKKPVAIEISLSSSDLILGVRGKDHPLPSYLAAGVPVVIATDDAGVSRSDLTNEYVRAAREHGLGYRTLKAIARNALIHSFLPPSDKRAELQRFDRASVEFERTIAGRRWQLQHLVELVKAAVVPPQ